MTGIDGGLGGRPQSWSSGSFGFLKKKAERQKSEKIPRRMKMKQS